MEDNKTYFGEIGHGLKTLATGMKITWQEYFKDFFTNKSTEQYPENRKTTLHVAKRHRGRLVKIKPRMYPPVGPSSAPIPPRKPENTGRPTAPRKM